MRKVWASPSPDSRVMFTSYTVTSWSAGKGSQVRLPSGHDMDHCSPCGAEGAVRWEGGVEVRGGVGSAVGEEMPTLSGTYIHI